MSRWPIVALGEIAIWGSGGTPSRSARECFGPGTPWLSIADLNDGYVTSAKESLTPIGLQLSAARTVPAGTLLVAMYGSIGKLGIATMPVCTSQAIAFAIPHRERVDGRYLFWFLLSERRQLLRSGRGGTQLNITQGDLKRWPIPLPPIEEQRRIASILDRADALRAKRRKSVALLDHLTQSMFVDMFGDLVGNDRAWPRARVSDFVAGFESGKSLTGEDADDRASAFRVLRVSAVTSLRFRAGESRPVPVGYTPPSRHIVREGDLLFSRANTLQLVGATALATEVPPNLLLPDKLWRFVWPPTSRAEPLFVRQLFQQPEFRREVAARATGTSGSMKNVSQPKVLSILVGLPPLEVQRAFASKVETVERMRTVAESLIVATDELFLALQYGAFRGEL